MIRENSFLSYFSEMKDPRIEQTVGNKNKLIMQSANGVVGFIMLLETL